MKHTKGKKHLSKTQEKKLNAFNGLLKTLIQLNKGFKSEWGDKDNSDRVCKNLDYWNKIASVAIKKYKS